MRMRLNPFVGIWLLLGVSLSMMGCDSDSPTSPAVVTITAQNAGETVELHVGDTLNVVLTGNPSTGYNWTVDTLNQAFLRSVGEPQFTPDSDAIGSGGKITLSFSAVAAGETRLKLLYQRPWERETPPLYTFEVDVVVK